MKKLIENIKANPKTNLKLGITALATLAALFASLNGYADSNEILSKVTQLFTLLSGF